MSPQAWQCECREWPRKERVWRPVETARCGRCGATRPDVRVTTFPAGSTPGEKERGLWLKATPEEIRKSRRVLAYHVIAKDNAPPLVSFVRKLYEALP